MLLGAGSALGRGCGPLVISKRPIRVEELAAGRLRVAVPGLYTTANFLFSLAFPNARDKSWLIFSDIESAVLRGDYDAGVIIHENRFTYEDKGLVKVADLGEFWEQETGALIPLGGIVIRRSLSDEVKHALNRVVRRSIEYAFAHPDVSLPYVRAHAQEMSEAVMYRHIELYVNEYSLDLGAEGRAAVRTFFDLACDRALIPMIPAELFFPPPAPPS